MKRLVAAIMFLTRLRVPGNWDIQPSDIGRAAAFYPLIGAGIGSILYGFIVAMLHLMHWGTQHWQGSYTAPAPLLAVLVIVLSIAITGGLHLDGLADTIDGFGGGHSRHDVLRIMREPTIGAFGAIGIMLVLALKMASVLRFIQQGSGFIYLIVAPLLARASAVILGFAMPYARAGDQGLGSAVHSIGVFEVLFSFVTAVALAIGLAGWRAGASLAVVVLASLWNALLCKKKIRGITGDTIGANLEICETLVLVTGAILTL